MSFEDFLTMKSEQAKAEGLDATQTIERFRSKVDAFYHELYTNWLAGFIERMKPERVPINITEEQLGTYSVDSLTLTVGPNRLQFAPVGTILIGTRGRIDLQSGQNTAMFILTGQQARSARNHIVSSIDGQSPREDKMDKEVWKLVDTEKRMKFVDITPKVMQNLIMKIAR